MLRKILISKGKAFPRRISHLLDYPRDRFVNDHGRITKWLSGRAAKRGAEVLPPAQSVYLHAEFATIRKRRLQTEGNHDSQIGRHVSGGALLGCATPQEVEHSASSSVSNDCQSNVGRVLDGAAEAVDCDGIRSNWGAPTHAESQC